MKKLLFLVFFIMIQHYVFGQNDSLKPQKKIINRFGISLGVSINILNPKYSVRNNPYPYCEYLGLYIIDPILDYKVKLYKNAFHDALIAPEIIINYWGKNYLLYSLGIGFTKAKRYPIPYYPTDNNAGGSFKNLFITFQTTYRFFNNKRNIIHPFIGLKAYYAHKVLSDSIPWFNWPTDRLTDKSNILLFQVPLGILVCKHHIYASLECALNLLGVINGKQDFIPGNKSYYKESIYYSNIIFADRIIHEKYFMTNFKINIGFNF